MKVCKFCGSDNDSHVIECANCGAKEFKNICDNCGTAFDGNICSKCGVRVGEQPRICYNCGKKTYKKVCPDCGADLLHPKQNMQDSQQDINVVINNNWAHKQYEPPKPSKSNDIVLFLVLFFIFFISAISIGLYNESTSNNVAQQKLSDMEILNLDGHPRFYGDYDEAAKFWKGYQGVKVINGPNRIFNLASLLTMATGDKDKNAITDITICFSTSKDSNNELTLDDVLKAACAYIPYDIIEKYYVFDQAFSERHIKGGDYRGYYYVMTLNDEGYAANKSGKVHYEDKFAFNIAYMKSSWIIEMNPLAYIAKHDTHGVENYIVEEWKVNLDEYRDAENHNVLNEKVNAK